MNNSALAYGLIFDNLLGLSAQEIRRLVNLYALLYQGLVVSDSWMLTNQGLQEVLSTADGHLLIREGIITTARRTSTSSLTDFLAQATKKRMHGVVATPEFTQRIDAIGAQDLSFDLAEVGPAYQAMAAQVLKPEFLISFGMSEEGIRMAEREYGNGRQAGVDVNTNTFVKDTVCPLLSQNDAELLMEAVRAPYSLNLPNVLGTGIVGPQGFRGDRILAALRGQTVPVGNVDLGEVGTWSTTLRDPMVGWLLNEELSHLTVEELVIVRSTSRRDDYLRALNMFMQVPTDGNWRTLEARLDGYLRKAGHDVFQSRQRKIDPLGSEVALTGNAGALLIIPNIGGSPVRLNPLGGEGGAVRVVGRTYQRPDMSVNPETGTAA